MLSPDLQLNSGILSTGLRESAECTVMTATSEQCFRCSDVRPRTPPFTTTSCEFWAEWWQPCPVSRLLQMFLVACAV